jgi:hypothetical protein
MSKTYPGESIRDIVQRVGDNPHLLMAELLDTLAELERKENILKHTRLHDVVPLDTIIVEEFADADDRLESSDIPEETWLETLSRKTGMDMRMILGFKPVTHIGLYRWQVVGSKAGELVYYSLDVWVVPA